MPYHIRIDEADENLKDTSKKIGTTKNGIGPCYADKVNRVGIRVIDLMDEAVFKEKLRYNIDTKNRLFEKYYGVQGFDYDEVLKEYLMYAEQLRPFVKDTDYSVNTYILEGKKVLFEGAQASMLDLDHVTQNFSICPINGLFCIKHSSPAYFFYFISTSVFTQFDAISSERICLNQITTSFYVTTMNIFNSLWMFYI